MYVTSYGDGKGKLRGIVKLGNKLNEEIEKEYFEIEGKVNCCIVEGNTLYVPVKEDEGTYIYIIEDLENKLVFTCKVPVTYFYSYGFKGKDQCLYLASFESGVDSIFDLQSRKEVSFSIHKEAEQTGRSHYISYTPDERYVFSVDNALERIYIYEVINQELMIKNIVQFGDENIRLMSYSSYANCFYLNTEKNNVLYTLACKDANFIIKEKTNLIGQELNCFSGGNAISKDGMYLCVSIRGKNELQCYSIAECGHLTLIDAIPCGEVPRDVTFVNDMIVVTCTNSNVVEFYKIGDTLEKIKEVEIDSPITFSI